MQDDVAMVVAKTMDGGLFMPGTCNYGGVMDSPWYTRLGKQGSIIFQLYYNNANFFNAYSTVQTLDGGFILAGRIKGLER